MARGWAEWIAVAQTTNVTGTHASDRTAQYNISTWQESISHQWLHTPASQSAEVLLLLIPVLQAVAGCCKLRILCVHVYVCAFGVCAGGGGGGRRR